MPRRSFLTKAGTRPQAEFYSAALFWRNLILLRSNRIRPSIENKPSGKPRRALPPPKGRVFLSFNKYEMRQCLVLECHAPSWPKADATERVPPKMPFAGKD